MKILILIDWFSPAYKAGGPIQSILNLVNQPFAPTEFRIICSCKDLDGSLLHGVPYDEWFRFNESTEVWYISKTKDVLGVLKIANEWHPDILFINGIYSFYYNFLPLVYGKAVRKIVSARGMLHPGALSQKNFKKRIYLAVWKFLGLHRRNCFHATTLEEKKFIMGIFGKQTRVFIAQNFPRTFQVGEVVKKEAGSLNLISIGLVSAMKNYLPVIKSLMNCKSNIRYTIYGPIKDSAYWQICTEAITKLPLNIEVQYKGDLPSSQIESALTKAHVFVLPSKSENFGHAIYEALTAGKAVITSHNTPWNNLQESKAGVNISVDNDYELSNAICSFADMNEAEFANWSKGARTYAEQALDVSSIRSQHIKMFSLTE